jgi:hypothetical protein
MAQPSFGPVDCGQIAALRGDDGDDGSLFATSDDAPETASENRFRNAATKRLHSPGGGDVRRGLATAILAGNDRRQRGDGPA